MRNRYPFLFILIAVLLGSAVFSLCVGSTSIPVASLWEAATGHGDTLIKLVLWEIRLPRLLLALLVGSSLGLSGAAMQGLLRNPLVEPGLLGVSAGAGLGAVIAFYSGLSALFAYALPLAGMAGAAIAVMLVFILAGRTGSVQSLILAGVAVASICGALTSLVLNLSPNYYAATEIVFWMLGSLADRSMDHVKLVTPLVLAGSALLLTSANALRALSLGEETAHSLGFRPSRTRMLVVLGTSLAVGAAVSVTGGIAFVGLVIPHILRPLVKGDPGQLLPFSAVGGAILLLWADIAVRLLPTNQELKVGVVTALAGAPVFLLVLIRSRRSVF